MPKEVIYTFSCECCRRDYRTRLNDQYRGYRLCPECWSFVYRYTMQMEAVEWEEKQQIVAEYRALLLESPALLVVKEYIYGD